MDATTSEKSMASSGDVKIRVETHGNDEVSCPIEKNAALLKELDLAEGKVAQLLDVAAEALDELAGVESLNSAKVEASTKTFLGLVSSVHGTLSSKASLIRDYTPYPRSIYGPRKELELLHEKARFLRGTLADLSRSADLPPSGEAAAGATTTAVAEAATPVSGVP